MHEQTLKDLQQEHNFNINNSKAERRTQYVLILTAITMVVEIVAGTIFGSMALLADGWHMGTHVAAFLITIFAYRYAKKHEDNPEFSFGTGKVSVLGGFASAVSLGIVALMMIVESLERLIEPQAISFNAAIGVAILGLLVNVASAVILKDDHHHEHHDHHHHDHNLQAAYMHVLADALTSVLAIVALLLGKYFGWSFLDPLMGIVGAAIITRWAYGLVKQTSPILLDGSIEQSYQHAVQKTIEEDSDNRISDIHIWKVSANHYATMISLVTNFPKPTEYYKELLNEFSELAHITIEVNECKDEDCEAVNSTYTTYK